MLQRSSQYKNLLLENFLNPELNNSTDYLKESFSNLTKRFFENAELTTAYPNLFKLLWFSNIPCFKNKITDAFLLKKCFWNGKELDCSDIFKQVPSDSGMCCAFNAQSALRESSYSDLVKTMQDSQHNVKIDVKKIRTGVAKGLTVWLDQHGDKTSFGTVFENYNGFKVHKDSVGNVYWQLTLH